MNLGAKALQVLRTVAPALGTAIGGPFGALAGVALATALGTPAGDEKAAETALLAATPDQLVALKKAEQDFTVRMRELGISEEKLAFDDVADARARQTAVKDSTPAILAGGVTVGFFAVLFYIIRYGVPEHGGDAMLVLLGSLGTAWTSVVGYYFGSSIGARKSSETLGEIAKQP